MTNTPAPVDTDELANLMCALDVGGAKEDAALIEKTIDEIDSLRAENKRLQVSIEHDSEITVESLHARTAAERAQREAESKLAALTLQNERLKDALERLAKPEAFDVVQAIAGPLAKECRMRMEFAEQALSSFTPPDPSNLAEVVKLARQLSQEMLGTGGVIVGNQDGLTTAGKLIDAVDALEKSND